MNLQEMVDFLMGTGQYKDEEELYECLLSERKRMREEGTLKTLETTHGTIEYIDHSLLK